MNRLILCEHLDIFRVTRTWRSLKVSILRQFRVTLKMSKCSHNMRRFIYLAFLLLAACSPKPTETNGSGGTSNRPQTIIGNCRWIRSSGGFAGETIYPKAEELQTYQFTSDSTAY